MKWKGVYVSITFVIMFLMCFFVRQVYSGEIRGVSEETIKIGIMFSQTGAVASSGIPYTTAARNYFRYINEAGGIHGRKIKTIVEDDRYSIPLAFAAFKKLVYRDKVLALMALGGTGPMYALYESIQKDKMPSLGAGLPESCVKPHKRYVFIPGGTYREMMEVLCDYIMNDLPVKKPRIAVVVPDHEAGHQDFKSFVERLEQYGIKIADKEILNFGAMEATTQVLSIKKANVDYVVMGGSIVQNCTVLLRGMRKFGVSVPVFGSWATCSEDLVEVSGEAAKNYSGVNKFASWYEDTPGVKLMREITKKYKTGEKKLFRSRLYTQGWLSAMIYAESMKRAGRDLDGETLVNTLEALRNFESGDLTAPITYGKNDHSGNRSWKVYKANVEKKILEPVTDWRDPKQLK